jgi:hypothetical protein
MKVCYIVNGEGRVDILKGLYSIGNVIYYCVRGGVAVIAIDQRSGMKKCRLKEVGLCQIL